MKKMLVLLIALVILLSQIVCLSAIAEDTVSTSYGYIDKNGNIVIKPSFDYAFSFSNGLARILTRTLDSDGQLVKRSFGFIDRNGEIVIPTIYDDAQDFSRIGTACVSKNEKYGVIDIEGNTVIDFKYDYISYNDANDIYIAFYGELEYGQPQAGAYCFLNTKGVEISHISADQLYTLAGYCAVMKKNKWALASLDGKYLTDFIYDQFYYGNKEAISFFLISNFAIGYLDPHGNEFLKAKYDYGSGFINGKAIVKYKNQYMLIDMTGAPLAVYNADYVNWGQFDGKYTYAFEGSLDNGGFPQNGKYYLMDIDGNYLSSGYKEAPSSCNNGNWVISDENSEIYFQDGTKVCEIECEFLIPVCEDRLAIRKDGLWALADIHGNLITDYIYDDIDSTNDDFIPVRVKKNN